LILSFATHLDIEAPAQHFLVVAREDPDQFPSEIVASLGDEAEDKVGAGAQMKDDKLGRDSPIVKHYY
jgi:hypothetical protein